MTDQEAKSEIELAEVLNRNCHCITLDREHLRRALTSEAGSVGLPAGMLTDRPHLFSASPVFLAPEHLLRMQQVVSAIESLGRNPGFRSYALARAPEIARLDFGPRGVFFGYDFHLGEDGPQLIEVNTNAGGALLNTALALAQKACCEEVDAVLGGACAPKRAREDFVSMFLREWRLQRGDAPLETIAIVDAAPGDQYLYPEFELFRELLEGAGYRTRIVDLDELRFEGGKLRDAQGPVDLVYNRCTDFYLQAPASSRLRAAYETGAAVVTPNPRTYALHADKRLLPVFTNVDRLRAWKVDENTIETLETSVPATLVLEHSVRDRLWKERKRWFFKPATGYGSKAAYRGDKLTRKTWERIAGEAYVAQLLVTPSRRTILIDGQEHPLKLDLRNYVYDGVVQLVAARLYSGQTTNFRTTGGGFAPVFTDKGYVTSAGAA